jgi:hypothetical protein
MSESSQKQTTPLNDQLQEILGNGGQSVRYYNSEMCD